MKIPAALALVAFTTLAALSTGQSVAPTAAQPNLPFRTWTAADGRSKEMLFLEAKDGQALFQVPQGRSGTIAIAKLGQEDRHWVELYLIKRTALEVYFESNALRDSKDFPEMHYVIRDLMHQFPLLRTFAKHKPPIEQQLHVDRGGSVRIGDLPVRPFRQLEVSVSEMSGPTATAQVRILSGLKGASGQLAVITYELAKQGNTWRVVK